MARARPPLPPSPVLSLRARDCVFTAIDFETTGSVPGWPVEPWQVGMAGVSAEGGVRWTWSSYLGVPLERPFNAFAPGRHASIRDVLAASPTLPQLWGDVAPRLVGVPLVAHNIGTERSVLRKAAPLHALGPWVDTLRLVRHGYPVLASGALEDVVDALGLAAEVRAAAPEGTAPHDALYDAIACGLLLRHFLSLPGWESATVGDLAAL